MIKAKLLVRLVAAQLKCSSSAARHPATGGAGLSCWRRVDVAAALCVGHSAAAWSSTELSTFGVRYLASSRAPCQRIWHRRRRAFVVWKEGCASRQPMGMLLS